MAAEAVLVRRWDDAAKDPDGPTLRLADLLAAHRRLQATRRPAPQHQHSRESGLSAQ
jgi:gamma-butyrobetaine dioxygenase